MAEFVTGCPYRSGLRCFKSAACENCGWNPEVEKKRLECLYSGAIKTYLHIDLSTFVARSKHQRDAYREGKQ